MSEQRYCPKCDQEYMADPMFDGCPLLSHPTDDFVAIKFVLRCPYIPGETYEFVVGVWDNLEHAMENFATRLDALHRNHDYRDQWDIAEALLVDRGTVIVAERDYRFWTLPYHVRKNTGRQHVAAKS